MPDTLQPVGKLTPVSVDSASSDNTLVKPVGKLQPVGEEVVIKKGFDPYQRTGEEEKMLAVGNVVNSLGFQNGYNDDEKKYLINLASKTNDYKTWHDALLIMGGDHPDQKDGSGLFANQHYYMDDNNLPVPLKYGQLPPKGKEVASVWGSQEASEDDSLLTTIGKNVASALPAIVQDVAAIPNLAYGLATGNDAEWYKELKNHLDSYTPKTSSASNQSFLDTSKVNSIGDLANPDNWHFTADNIAGNISSLASTVMQFMAGGEIAKGLGLGADALATIKASGVSGDVVGLGTKALAKSPYFVGSYMTNLGEALDAADKAGVKGRDKYAVASLVTIPVSMVDMEFGLMPKLLNNPAAMEEKNALIKSLIKGWKDSGGQATKEGLDELYKTTTIGASSVLGKIAKDVAQTSVSEGSEEVLQNFMQRASQQIYDNMHPENKKVGEGKYGTEIADSKALGDYINDFIGGAVGGGLGGGAIGNYRRAKAEVQSENAYDYIKKGADGVIALKAELGTALKTNRISKDEYDLGVHKIDTYAKYFDQTKDLNLDDKSNRRIFDLTWSNENLKQQESELNNNPESNVTGTIPHRRLLDTQALLKSNSLEMGELMAKSVADQQTAVSLQAENKLKESEISAKNPSVIKVEAKPETVYNTLLSQIKSAENEKDLDSYLKQADTQGITTPKIVDEVGKKRHELLNPIPSAVKTELAVQEVAPEHRELHEHIVKRHGVKDFNNLAEIAASDKADSIKEFMEDKKEPILKGGVIKLGEYANKVVNGKQLPIYYAVNFGGKEIKFASSNFTNFIKEKNLVDRKVAVQLIKPTDTNLDELVKDEIIEPHNVVERTDVEGKKEKYFVFNDDENKTRHPYIMVARSITKSGKPGVKIANLAISDYSKAGGIKREGVRVKGRPVAEEKKPVTASSIAPEKKTEEGFDKGSSEPDYEAEIKNAKSVTIEEEDNGETFDITPTDEKRLQYKKRSEMLPETQALRDKKIALLKKALPGIAVVEDESIGDDVAGQLDADGKTVRLNPNYNFQDTPIHEFAHALIDIMGGTKSALIQKGIKQLRGTKLWKDTAALYPELSEDMLSKEVLAEAVGREGARIFDTKEKQSSFRNWLDGVFFKIKKMLGIEKSIVKNLASRLLSGKRIASQTAAFGEIQKKKDGEEKTLLSVRPLPYKKWLNNQDFDEFAIKERIADLKEEIADAEGEPKDILEGELELAENSLENHKQAYEDYVVDHKAIQDFVQSKGDVSNMNLEELNEIRSQMIKYDDIVKTRLYKDLLYNIGVKTNELQTENLKAADPDYNPEEEQKGDLTKTDIWAQGLSTIGQKFPAIQAFYKMYRSASGAMNKELNSIRTQGHDLAQKVIKDYQKNHSVAERVKNFTIGGGNKYFSFLAKDGKLVEKGSPEYAKLSKAQKDLLDFITEKKSGMDQYMDTDSNALLKSGAGFIETFQKSGLFKAYANYITSNHNLRNVKVSFKNPETGKTTDEYFGDVEAILNQYGKNGSIKKVEAMTLLTRYNLKARKGLEISKGSKGKYFLKPDGTLVSMFGGEFKGDFTENYYETFMKYAQDAVFSKNMSPLIPTLTGVEMLYKSMGNDKENVSKFLDVVKRGKFLGETIESGLGEKADKVLRVLRKWTSWRFIAFNIPANVWNIMVGEYNQFRADGLSEYARGKNRFFKSMLKGKKNAKAFNILKKYNPELMTDIDNINPEKHVGKYFDMLAFGGQKLGEGLIRGSAIIGKLSTEHYNWLDNKGNLKGSSEEVAKREKIIKAEIDKYISEVERVQGRYSNVEKRNFAYFELGQFFGQFKVWMPEWMSDRFANTYIDADGIKRKGSFRTLFSYGMKDFLRDARTKEFYTGTDPKHVAARKQLRGMVITAVLLSAYLGASDDDEDKDLANQLDKALRNISSVYRMDNNTFLISQPAAAMSVVVDLSKTLNAAIGGQKYKSGKNEGDYKALAMAYNLLPANKLISTPIEMISDEK